MSPQLSSFPYGQWSEKPAWDSPWAELCFALIGVEFMMIEIALLQRMSVFLAHPEYALSVVLFNLILSAGFGGKVSQSLPVPGFACAPPLA